MNRTNIEAILDFVRIDGRPTSPICFLTIEDGGGFEENHVESEDNFMEYFKKNNKPWEIQQGDFKTFYSKGWSIKKRIGTPGIVLCKIMSHLSGLGIENYTKYYFDHLYLSNELNVKYYPIARSSMRQNDHITQKIEKYIDISLIEYEDLCRMVRPKTFTTKFNHIFNENKYFIIGAAKYEWLEVLRLTFSDIDFLSTMTTRDHNGKISHQHYFDKQGNICFSHFNFFKKPLFDKEICCFADELRDLGVSKKLTNNFTNA